MSAIDRDVLKIIQITDTHMSADPGKIYHGVNTNESLSGVIQYIKNHYPHHDLTLATGDLVHDETEAGYQRIRAHLERLNTPVLCLPGNHDLPVLMDSILCNEHIRTGGSIIHKTWQIILLDSTVSGEVGGHLEQRELVRLDTCLTGSPEHHALICLHHPPFLTGSHWLDSGLLLDNPADLFAVIDRHEQVRCVLWGHIHQEFYRKRNTVEYFATPSTMIQFKPNSYDFAVDDKLPGFRWLDLYPDGRIDTGIVYVQNAV